VTLRTRTFLAVFVASAVALAVVTALVERTLRAANADDVRQALLHQAELVADLFARQGPWPSESAIDDEADALAARLGVRVTLLDATGRVVGESQREGDALDNMVNHADREEVVDALRTGVGVATRRSDTTAIDTMYAAVRADADPVRIVRLALPLTRIEDRVEDLRLIALVGLGAGLLVAVVATLATSLLIHRRLQSVAETARRYMAGDFSRPARDHGQDEIGTVANVLDATARELGARLREVERERAQTDAILSGMVEGVLLVDRDGRLVLSNPAARQLLSLSGRSTGLHYLEVVRQPAIATLMAAALDGQPTTPAEIDLDRDPVRRVMANVVALPTSPGGAVLVLHDITDLRHADQVRRDFVANVSHELRTPLTAIRGYVEALLDAPPEPVQARHFLEVIARHSLRMERLVRDLLRLARLDAGQESLDRVPCRVADVFAGVAADLEPVLKERRQAVTTTIESDAAVVSADTAKLQDILRNLLENASNYSPEGSTIALGAKRHGDVVELTVSDQGPGIPEGDLPRIFERFYRADRSRSRDPGGTGLGLSIARHLAGLHQATLSAANRPGGGAVFTLRMPDEVPDGPDTHAG
jgi:two-component system phosphate regulon sensor histidine kinase PhoR